MQSIICFTSDFGTGDTWVGVCHAVVYRACPQARVVDLAHDIQPFDIRKAAAVAASGVWQLPEAIHLVVVDPGVGGSRRDLCLVTGEGTVLIGPDNGVLIPATWRSGGIAEAYAIEPESLTFRAPLATFHARDVLAPAAAALACGVEPSAVGGSVAPASLAPAPFSPCHRDAGGFVAEVVDIERFGSMRFAVTSDDLSTMVGSAHVLRMSYGHITVDAPIGMTFSDVAEGDPVVMFDSSGWLTLAVRMGSAAEQYGAEVGDAWRIDPPA